MNKFFYIFSAVAVMFFSIELFGGSTAPYKKSDVSARLNVSVEPGVKTVHFVRDNADPSVYTKTYVLKYADPFEIRTQLREMVRTRRVDGDTGIQVAKFNDGTGVLMISAEEYLFEDTAQGKGFDSIVAMLDKPNMRNNSGSICYLYNPKFRNATELKEMVAAVGAAGESRVITSTGESSIDLLGVDLFECDRDLNLIFFNTALYSRKSIEDALKSYDVPYSEVRAKITVYELYAENDTKLGLDFQAWKNNDGVDFFNTGGRFMQNYAPSGRALLRGGGYSDSTFFHFNPKWNTKYLDFLTSIGKAKVVTSAELTAHSGQTATLKRMSQLFYAKQTPIEDLNYSEDFWYEESVAPGVVVGVDKEDKNITTAVTSDVTWLRLGVEGGQNFEYIIYTKNGSFNVGDTQCKKVRAKKFVLPANKQLVVNDVCVQRGNRTDITPSKEYGLSMYITPMVAGKVTTLKVVVNNSSLIGYTSGGEPRIQQDAGIDTQFMIANDGTQIYIGGIEKRDVVRVSGGLPILKDIPVLGWLFSTENESTKRSMMVIVAEVVPVPYDGKFNPKTAAEVKKIQSDLKEAGETNSYGYRQFYIDKSR